MATITFRIADSDSESLNQAIPPRTRSAVLRRLCRLLVERAAEKSRTGDELSDVIADIQR